MNISSLTHTEVGQIVIVLARIGISREDMATIFSLSPATVDVRLKDVGYLRFSNIPGWQRGLSRRWDEIKTRVENYLENLEVRALTDQLTPAQKEMIKEFLATWLDHQKDAKPYRGYHPRCDRKVVVRRLYRLGISTKSIAYITGYDLRIVHLDLEGHKTECDKKETYSHAFFDYAQGRQNISRGVFIEEGIQDAVWYCKILERYLKMNEIFAYALGVWQTVESLEVPSFTKEQEPYVRLYLALIGQPNLLSMHQARESTAREIRYRWERYLRGVADKSFAPPKNEWEVTSYLTTEISEDLRDRVWPAWKEEWCRVIDQLITELSDQERYVILEYYGFNGIPASSSEIAEKIQRGRACVDQITHRALSNMRRKSMFKLLERQAIPLGSVCYAQAELQKNLKETLKMVEEMRGEEPTEEMNEHLFKSVEELDLSVRSANCLQNAGIEYIYQLVEHTEAEMLKTKNFGRKSLNEIKEILAEIGLELGMKLPKVALFHPPKEQPTDQP